MRLATYRYLFPLPACILAQLSFGSFYAFGIFTSHLPSTSAKALTYALGLTALTDALSFFIAGLALHSIPSPSPVRPLTFISAVLLLIATVLPAFRTAVAARSGLLSVATLAMGCAYGTLYVVSVHVAQLWVPRAPGTATGVVVTASGIGSLLFVRLNTSLVTSGGGVPAAMRISTGVATALAAIAVFGMSVPPLRSFGKEEEEFLMQPKGVAQVEEESPCLIPMSDDSSRSSIDGQRKDTPAADTHISASEMIHTSSFWLLLTAVNATLAPGFGIVLAGSRMQTVLLGVPHALADSRFFWITLVGVASRLFVGVLIDLYGKFLTAYNGAQDCELRAAKAVTMLLLVFQTGAIVAARLSIEAQAPRAFAISLAIVYWTFSGGAVVLGCLGKALFPTASTLAFALVGFSVGLGDVVFSAIVASCASSGRGVIGSGVEGAAVLNDNRNSDYDLFFIISAVFSTVGYVACESIGKTLADKELRVAGDDNVGSATIQVAYGSVGNLCHDESGSFRLLSY